MVTFIAATPIHQKIDRNQWHVLRIAVLFLAALVFITSSLVGCGGGVSTATVPPQSGPPQGGPPTTGTATISWAAPSTNVDGTPLTSLAGYKVYYGSTPGIYSHIDVGYTSVYQVAGLTKGQMYYFTVTAYDSNGNESDYSNIVSKVIS